MRVKSLILISIAMLAASPAHADQYFAVTPSGSSEMRFGENPGQVVGKLSSRCIDLRWTVINSSTNELTCEAPLNFGQSLLGTMLMGNAYSTPPRRFFRFNVAEVNGISRVQGSGWMELQMAFGQVKRTEFSGAQFHNNILAFMATAGGKYPVGTTFPNHAAMGTQIENVVQGKNVYFRVTQIDSGSAAERAGIKSGDMVSAIAGKSFKNFDDYLDATAKAAKKPTYEVSIFREGNPIKLSVERAFRPVWNEAVTPVVNSATGPGPGSSAPLSIADELTKLQKLKESGILTEDEFLAQKKKLLGQ